MPIILVHLTDSFDQWRVKTNSISLSVGDINILSSGHTDIVSSLNSNFINIGTLSTLSTTAKNNLVSAINEVDSNTDTNNIRIGTLSTLSTTAKNNLVSAINEVATNANLTGDVTSVGNATTLGNAPVIAKVLTGYTSGAGTISATDSILSAIQKLDGNVALKATITQATSAVVITGGSINNTTIGETTPSTGVFTTITLGGYTVGTLPAGTIGMKTYVTDATAPTYLGALTGGGAVVCPVFYNGTAWVSA